VDAKRTEELPLAGGEMIADFKTTGVAPEARAAYWTKGFTSRFAPVRVDPANSKEFQAQLKVRSLGPVTFAWVRSQPSTVVRTKELAAQANERLFGFVIQLHGKGAVSHCGHCFGFTPGDIVLNDTTEPMSCSFPEPMEGLTVRVSEAALKARIPFVDDVRGVRIPGDAALVSTVVSMAKSLALSDDRLPADYGAQLANSLLDVFAMSYSAACGRIACEESVVRARQALVTEFIEARLHDPNLTPGMISSALRISPRYLRKLMAQYGETASSYILRRRLEESSKQLKTILYRNRTVTDIAFSLGFNSTAHFARVFKEKFGMTPTECRLMHTGEGGPLACRSAPSLSDQLLAV